jgi:CBS domain-containing protein/gamma-glutamyl:cysteine ligase YbdK (ATP-grasp superfamily)
MGEHNISMGQDDEQSQAFMQALLGDLRAFERMLDTGLIESGVHRIGAEQEMFLIDRALRPTPIAMQVLSRIEDPRLTTEIGKYNLEANLTPLHFSGRCLAEMEAEILELMGIARRAAKGFDADILLTGILPTIRNSDLSIENLTPSPRYEEMNRTLSRMRGNTFNVHIKGLDELQMTHDNLLLEACCTSFQVHLQVGPQEFARAYNLAQLITAPVLAVATNSPLLLGHRLWSETRIALFQHSVDERSSTVQQRNRPTRVSFGDAWIRDSVLEIFQEEIARYRILLTRKIEEDSLAVLERGELPQLAALRLHNGTVWRWNRPCYGISDGRAHLRIEMRAMPSGPSVPDEIANAAFFFGLMAALPEEYGDISDRMPFDDAKDNFLAAARQGIRAQFTWLVGESVPASTLVLEHLLPLARKGLQKEQIDSEDIDRYLGIIEERVHHGQTGSLWALRSLAGMKEKGTREQRMHALTASILEQQQSGYPVHTWLPATITESQDWRQSFQTVGQFMSTDLFTVRPDDLVDLAASVMDWRHVRHVPVEDDEGKLIGIISHRDLLRLMAHGFSGRQIDLVAVRDIMKSHPVTVTSDTPTIEAIRIMRSHNIGCLPVTDDGRLVGLLTAQDLLKISADLIEAHLQERESGQG